MAVSCEIENDIPYPTVEGSITAFEVEGMCDENGEAGGKAKIDKSLNKVNIYVDDTVDPSAICITRFEVTNNASILPVGNSCLYPEKFPDKSFSINPGEITKTNFTSPVHFNVRTYQDNDWTIELKQIIKREISLEGQVDNAVIDPISHNIIVYVNNKQNLHEIKVNKFRIGGQHGSVQPDPEEAGTYDFSALPTRFFVKEGWSQYFEEWSVFVYKTEAKTELTASVFPRTVNATVKGTKAEGETLLLEYKAAGESSWKVCPATDISTSGINYIAEIKELKPGTTYNFKVKAGTDQLQENSFSTTAALQLENAEMDNWSLEGERLYNPWAQGGSSFWDTGNRGATTVGDSNSKPTDETISGKGKAAILTSKYIVIKFAAGNIFTGTYKKTDGTNGILDFGRPFSAFPSKLTFDYKYKSAVINRVGTSDYSYLKGTPDECQVYIALTDWDEPFEIRTNPKNMSLFDKNDPHVIAYADMISSKDQNDWKTQTLELKYNYTDRTPKYILVVCTSSRYGDFFTGGEGSTLVVDNFKLIYE